MSKKSDKWVREDLMRLLTFCIFNFDEFELVLNKSAGKNKKKDFFEMAAGYVGRRSRCGVRQFFYRSTDGHHSFDYLRKEKDNHKAFHHPGVGLLLPSDDGEKEEMINKYLQNSFPHQFKVVEGLEIPCNYKIARINDEDELKNLVVKTYNSAYINQQIIEQFILKLSKKPSKALLREAAELAIGFDQEVQSGADQLKEINRYLCQTRIFDKINSNFN